MQNPNIIKLLSFLGGGASEGYGGPGKLQKVGGQPLLPKPEVSQPDAMSPYAPGNLGGQTVGSVQNNMQDSAPHPAAQLAQYLTTLEGRSPSARLKITGRDPGAFIRGGQG